MVTNWIHFVSITVGGDEQPLRLFAFKPDGDATVERTNAKEDPLLVSAHNTTHALSKI